MRPSGVIAALVEHLAKLPGVGKKSAERMAYHILNVPRDEADGLAAAIRTVRERIGKCKRCGSLAEKDLCVVCSDSKRDASVVCVVEMPRDVSQIEKTGAFRGLYHVLMGRLSPLEGIGPQDLRIRELLGRIERDEIREVIIATSETVDGDATAAYLEKILRGRKVRATRPARGLPAGSAIEFVDAGVLGEALRARRESKEG